jgi:hypothetical protein
MFACGIVMYLCVLFCGSSQWKLNFVLIDEVYFMHMSKKKKGIILQGKNLSNCLPVC